jgi:hypothetical protein
MMNYLKVAQKKTPAPPTTPSRSQGKNKKSKTVQLTTEVPGESLKHGTNSTADLLDTAEWKVVEPKSVQNASGKQKKASQNAALLLSDSDSDSETQDTDNYFTIPEKVSTFLWKTQFSTFRYILTLELDTTLDPQKFLKSSVAKVNQALKRFTTEVQLTGYPGKAQSLFLGRIQKFILTGLGRELREMEIIQSSLISLVSFYMDTVVLRGGNRILRYQGSIAESILHGSLQNHLRTTS